MVTFKYAMESIRDWEAYLELIREFKERCLINRRAGLVT